LPWATRGWSHLPHQFPLPYLRVRADFNFPHRENTQVTQWIDIEDPSIADEGQLIPTFNVDSALIDTSG
jgi:hypothetical protein